MAAEARIGAGFAIAQPHFKTFALAFGRKHPPRLQFRLEGPPHMSHFALSGTRCSFLQFRTLLRLSTQFVCVAILLGLPLSISAQSTAATLSGTITDQQGALVPDVAVTITNEDTGASVATKTNRAGIYSVPGLDPGRYQVLVKREGFKQIALRDLTLNVQDVVSRNFTLDVGGTSETIQVNGSQMNINTTDGTVSTVVDRNFIENIPLNGRSLQTLIMLTPGVVFPEPSSFNSQGQFSVNGMRTDSNYFAVDGVAANLGTDEVGNSLSDAAAGSMPGFNATGGTNGLVSVDAIQEFRIQTSSFAPEFGRTPGAQVAIETRSGANSWHGTAFDYLRNDVFDANDWFADQAGLPKGKERQNDFGGVFSGPIAKSHTFFFFSYEGLRLLQPEVLQGAVPDATARAEAPAALQPFLSAYPLPNAPELTDNLAGYNVTISNPTTMNSYSIRVDQSIGSKLRLFGRYAFSPSSASSAGSPGSIASTPNNTNQVSITTHTLTLGLDETITNRIMNELRANYSNLKSAGSAGLSTLGGAVPPSSAVLSQVYPPGIDPKTAEITFALLDGSSYFYGSNGVSEQRQANVVDNLSVVKGSHALKFGGDVRWLAPFQHSVPYFMYVYFNGINGPGGVLSGQTLETDVEAFSGVSVRAKNFSVYAQDTWKVSPRLTLTYGLRWDVNPAPQGNNLASDPLVATGLNDPATMSLAPRGTPFFATTWGNIAPRFGAAFQLRGRPGRETILRGGIGKFYSVGSGTLGSYSLGYPFQAFNSFPSANFPLTPQQAAPPTVDLSGPAGPIVVAEPNLSLPRIYQWNVAVEQALGRNQALTMTYLGSAGRDLLRNYDLDAPDPNFGSLVSVTTNQGASNYQALQVQFQRQASHGLQVLASYSYSHSIDNASDSYSAYSPVALGSPNIDRGNSAFDVRHSGSGALIYELPAPPTQNKVLHHLFAQWSVEDLVIARTAFPVDLTPYTDTGFIGPYEYGARPNIVPGVPFYLYGNQYPGGKAFNPAAFTDPAPGTEGDLGRNTLRGFGLWQDNFALHRQFNITERVSVQFRAESFNLLNHPAFADPYGSEPIQSPFFGISTGSLANGQSNGAGNGLNSLYQTGAPRSWQFGLKLSF